QWIRGRRKEDAPSLIARRRIEQNNTASVRRDKRREAGNEIAGVRGWLKDRCATVTGDCSRPDQFARSGRDCIHPPGRRSRKHKPTTRCPQVDTRGISDGGNEPPSECASNPI